MAILENENQPKTSGKFAKLTMKSALPKLDWLSGGGEIAALIRAKDWSATSIGPIEQWPQSLQTTVSLCLASNFPINIIWGPEAIQIYNSGYKVLCGDAHPRALGESFRDTWESAWPVIGEPFEKAWLGETTYLENQRMFLTRNGYLEETFFTFSMSPIRDEAGEVVGLFNPVTETTTAMLNHRRTRLLRDITSESTNSDNLSEAVGRITRTLGDYTSDITGAVIFLANASEGFEAASTTGDVEGLTDTSKWPVDHVISTLEPYFIDQRACLMPIKQLRHDRPIGFIAATLSPRLPFNETYMAFFDMLNDAVSGTVANALANENIEMERAELHTDIHHLKSQRNSSEAAAQRLLAVKEAAEAATRSKSTFLANMSHEIRTPLAAILGFSEILKSHDLNIEDRDRYLNIITRSGTSLVRIIDDILDLSKIEAGKIQIEKEPVNLTDLVTDVLAMFSDRALGKGLAIHFDPKTLPDFPIEADAVRLRQILINLLGNAIKFTSEGSVTLTCDFEPYSETHFEINLRVTDTGIGITSEQAEILFEAFTQADSKTTRNFGGTGLGLALSRKLAKAMGGDVSIEQNAKASGTTFLIKLVVEKSIAAITIDLPEETLIEKVGAKPLAGWTILVVDDSEDNRLLMKIMLGRQGANVHDAASGVEAITKAHKANYDVVLMDIQMPEMDGYETLAKLRSDNYKKPVFALTAHSMKEEKDRAIAAGFSGHISKPVDRTAIVETLLTHARKLH